MDWDNANYIMQYIYMYMYMKSVSIYAVDLNKLTFSNWTKYIN